MTTLSNQVSPRSRPTMRDVAAMSGVSLKTVSRVINGEPGVREELAVRVRAAAEALHYQHNLGASSLRRLDGQTGTIALMLDDVANPFSSGLHRALEDAARERGVVVFAGSLDEDVTRERELAESFIARRVDGLVVVPIGRDQSHLAKEKASGTPIVCVDRPPRLLDSDVVVSDNRAGARGAVQHLIGHGHRRIAFLGDLETINTVTERLDGYLEALRAAGVPFESDLVRCNLRTSEQGCDALAALLTLPDPPTAVFASQNLLTMGAVRALRNVGLQHKVALVGFDDVPFRDLLEPGLTVVLQDVKALGSTAARLLFARLDGYQGAYEVVYIPTTLVAGGSGEIPGPFDGSRRSE